MKNDESKVAAFIARKIDASSKSQSQIAQEAGFPRSNMISMIKSGFTRLPVGRCISVANAIGADPVELFRLCMEEYTPDLLKITDEVYGREQLNDGEKQLLNRLRFQTRGKAFRLNEHTNAMIDDLAQQLERPSEPLGEQSDEVTAHFGLTDQLGR